MGRFRVWWWHPRGVLMVLALMALFTFGAGVLRSERVSAAVKSGSVSKGFFTNRSHNGSVGDGKVFANEMKDVGSGTELITFIWGKLGSSEHRDRAGASYIICTMLPKDKRSGCDSHQGVNVNDDEKGNWRELVDLYQARGLIGVRAYSDKNNSMYGYTTYGNKLEEGDVFTYTKSNPVSDQSLVFFDPNDGKVIYAIKLLCGNPVGGFSNGLGMVPLPVFYESIKVNGRPSATIEVQAGEKIEWTHSIKNNGRVAGATRYYIEGGGTGGGGVGLISSSNPQNSGQIAVAVDKVVRDGSTNYYNTTTSDVGKVFCQVLWVEEDPILRPGKFFRKDACAKVVNTPTTDCPPCGDGGGPPWDEPPGSGTQSQYDYGNTDAWSGVVNLTKVGEGWRFTSKGEDNSRPVAFVWAKPGDSIWLPDSRF